jgi:hypothetical protein
MLSSPLLLSRRLLIALMAAALASACAGSSGGASTSPTAGAKASSSPGVSATLEPAVAMPGDFPSDVPIYPGARLTAGAKFPNNGKTTWGMEWETLDSVGKVQAFYSDKLGQGDWTIQFSGSTGTAFSAVFTRKSSSKASGLLAADASSGMTKIELSLANA